MSSENEKTLAPNSENSDATTMPPSEVNENATKESVPQGRLRWIDMARGFVMFYLVFAMAFPPKEWAPEGSILFFLFEHPGVYDTYMDLYDVGTPAFIFIIGLSFSIAFRRRMEKEGFKKAIMHIVVRYGLLLILGIVILLADGFTLVEEKRYPLYHEGAWYPQYSGQYFNVVRWDVIPSLGAVGLFAIPFILIKNPKIRMAVAYLWMLLYQILFFVTPLRAYAQLSVHGGIFGTLFTFTSVMVIGSALGDMIFYSKIGDKKTYSLMATFGLANLVIGIALSFIPGWEATKRQGGFTYGVISIGVIVLGLMVFVYLDKVKGWKSAYLEAFGRNPFFTYFIAVVPEFVLKETVGLDLGMGWVGSLITTAIFVTYTSLILMHLYKKNKIISTIRATLYFLITAIILAILLISLGIV